MADGGTLFLDEVDTLPLAAQAKLLRFLQEGTYRPLGSQRFFHTNVRLIAASNRDLTDGIRTNQFGPDLYFRLNVLPLHLPPLRYRRADIAILAQHFLGLICSSSGNLEKTFSSSP
jgi:two-component system response regulator GlrR